MKYLMVLPVEFYQVGENQFVCESPFATHLRELLPRIKDWADGILLCAPEMSKENYDKNKGYLVKIDSSQESLFYQKAYDASISRIGFFLTSPIFVWPKLWQAVKQSSVVHSGLSHDPFKLFEIVSLVMAVIAKKKSIFVIDIDHRNTAKMAYNSGTISLKSYLLKKFVYDPIITLQIKFAVKYCNLVLFKGQSLVDSYGKGKLHVKNFYNTTHNTSMVISETALSNKIQNVNRGNRDIKLVYFGRVVEYKGILDMIAATERLHNKLKAEEKGYSVSLTVIGSGQQKLDLEKHVKTKNIGDYVLLKDAVVYGSELFKALAQYDFLLAAPHHEDTPRSVFDAMASALPVIAYNTYYYTDLEKTGTVKTVPWNSVKAMADKIEELANDPEAVMEMMKRARDLALDNTQEGWMDKRQAWTQEFLS